MAWIPRLGAGVATLAVVALGVSSVRTAHAHPDETLAGGHWAALALQFAAGTGAWCAGIYAFARLGARGWSGLLAAAGIAVFLTGLNSSAVGASVVFTVALAGGGLVPQLAGGAALAYAAPERTLPIAYACVIATGLVGGVAAAVLFDPRASGCFACSENKLLLHADPELHAALIRWGLRVSLATAALLATLALWAWARSAHEVRPLTAPVAIAGSAAAAIGGSAAAYALDQPAIDATARALWLVQCALVLVMALGIATRAALARRLRDKVASIVLGALPDAQALRTTLAASLGDPRLQLVFPRDGGGAVTAEGDMAGPLAADQSVLSVTRDSQIVAEVRHDRVLAAVPERLGGAIRAGGLALEHAASRARLIAELAELSASRARIVELGDAERRRLKRDLHDGAQQRLIALAISLQSELERTSESIARDTLSAARHEIRHAIEELRTIAQGIHPVTLTDAGLIPALHELAEGSGVPVRLEELPEGRADALVEAAAYRVIADTVRCAEQAEEPGVVRVRIERSDSQLRIDVRVAGGDRASYDAALAHAADRAGALGGEVRVAGAVTIEMWVPCVS